MENECNVEWCFKMKPISQDKKRKISRWWGWQIYEPYLNFVWACDISWRYISTHTCSGCSGCSWCDPSFIPNLKLALINSIKIQLYGPRMNTIEKFNSGPKDGNRYRTLAVAFIYYIGTFYTAVAFIYTSQEITCMRVYIGTKRGWQVWIPMAHPWILLTQTELARKHPRSSSTLCYYEQNSKHHDYKYPLSH